MKPDHSLLCALLVMQLGLAACSPPMTVEQQIIAEIRDMEARIEAVERRPFMSHVASDFTAQGGQMNREQFNAFVLYYMHRYKRLRAQLLPIRVLPGSEGMASASFQVLLTGGEGWLPETGQLYQVETGRRREGEDWLLHSAHWQQVAAER